MNRTWKSVFSVLLAVALLLPMVPAARAESEHAESVTLTADKELLYYRDESHAGTVTITAQVTPADYEGDITLKYVTEDKLEGETLSKRVSGGEATFTLRANLFSVGKTVYLKVDGIPSNVVEITVLEDKIEAESIRFTSETLDLMVGQSAKLSFNKATNYPSGDPADVTYSSDNAAVWVGTDGTVTAKAVGSATITAKINMKPVGNHVYVKVSAPSASVSGNAKLGTNFSMRAIHTELLSQFNRSYGKNPTVASFPGLTSTNGTLTYKDGNAVVRDGLYKFDDLLDMYLAPSSEGTFTCDVTVTDGTNVNVLNGKITISISVPSYTVYIPIDGSANYSFARTSADASGKTGAQLIREKLGVFGSIKFDAVPSASSNVGTLYTGSQPSNDNRVFNGSIVPASAVDELYFIPSRAGTYTISFTVYSGNNGTGKIGTGTLILPVDGSSLDVSFSLNSVAPYTFSVSPATGASSLYFQLNSAINGAVGGASWGGIRFDGAAKASTTGTLRQNSSYSRAISSSDYVPKTEIPNLYYVPERSGTYEITYGVYEDKNSTTAIATGKLTITTSAIPAGMSDITYTTTVKGSVTLLESDFVDFFQREKGSKYYLSYVVFDEYDGDGTFYHGANSFLPYNSADYYTSTYTGSVSANARYLDRVSFTAPSAGGYTAVLFTCYGGPTTNSTSSQVQGKLCVYYTADNVPAVSYNVFDAASVDLQEADFATVYSTAMKSSVSKPSFTIQLLSAPSKGTLYYYYSGSNRRALTSSNITNYTFSVNDKSVSSVEDLTYTPGRGSSGTDTVTYLATSSSGTVLYVGTIQFKLSADLTLNVTNDGSNFRLVDFYNANDSDPVLYVTFPQPSAGKVYVDTGSRYIAASAETRFYTGSALNGQYALTSAFYAPRANETGTVSIKCVAHRKSGVTNENNITVNVLSKISSGTFDDVGGVTGWAANSIDFASKIGLVNGTQLNPPRFSPSNTMRRSDFVLMLYRLAGSPAVSGTATYADVTSDKYYYNSAVWANRNNIMRNVTVNGLYDPEGALTRQDFAQILFNYTSAMGESTANNGSLRSYSDASSVSANTLEGVTWAVAKGYITSAVAGQLYIEPTRAATRAEISTLLHRYLTY